MNPISPVRPLRHTQRRNKLAERLRAIRQRDQEAYREPPETLSDEMYYKTRRGLSEYNRAFRTRFIYHLKNILKQKKEVAILDIGAGEGVLAANITKAMSEDRTRVKVYGISLARPSNEAIRNFTEYRVGNMEKVVPTAYQTRQFDLITCFGAGPSMRLIPFIAQKLSRQGKAFIEIRIDTRPQYEELVKRLAKRGFATTPLNSENSGWGDDRYYIVTIKIMRKQRRQRKK